MAGEILVGFEPLQGSSSLTGQLLPIHLRTFDRSQPFEFPLRFVDPALATLLIALLTPPAAGHDITLALVGHFKEFLPIPQFQLFLQVQLLHQGAQGAGR